MRLWRNAAVRSPDRDGRVAGNATVALAKVPSGSSPAHSPPRIPPVALPRDAWADFHRLHDPFESWGEDLVKVSHGPGQRGEPTDLH